MQSFRIITLLVSLTMLPAQAAAPPVAGATTRVMLGMLPRDAVAVLEVIDPPAAVASLRQAIGDLPPGMREQFGVSAWAGLAAVWFAIDGDPAAFAAMVAGEGLVLAVVPVAAGKRPHVVGIAQPRDGQATARWLQRFAERLPRASAGGLAVFGTDPELVTTTAARAGTPPGRWAGTDLGPPAAVRGAIDLAAIRRHAGRDAKTFDQLDAGARFLLLPLAYAATTAEHVTVALAGGERLTLRASAPVSARTSAGAGLFAATPQGGEVGIADDALGSVRLDRSVRALLAHPEKFLRPAEVLEVQGFLSIADAIDGARSSFVDDLLAGLEEPFTLHVLPVTPPEDGAPPRLQLPGFALLAKVGKPAAEAVMVRVAHALSLITNAERSQRGQGPFPLRAQSTATGRGFVAEPVPWRGPGAPPIEQGLSPTLWFENGHAVLASTFAAAQAVAARTYAPRAPCAGGDRLVLRGPAWADALATSRSVLELGRMLDEGEDEKAAARFFDILLLVVRGLREIGIAVDCTAERTDVELSMERVR